MGRLVFRSLHHHHLFCFSSQRFFPGFVCVGGRATSDFLCHEALWLHVRFCFLRRFHLCLSLSPVSFPSCGRTKKRGPCVLNVWSVDRTRCVRWTSDASEDYWTIRTVRAMVKLGPRPKTVSFFPSSSAAHGEYIKNMWHASVAKGLFTILVNNAVFGLLTSLSMQRRVAREIESGTARRSDFYP